MLNLQSKLKNAIYKPVCIGVLKDENRVIRVANFLGEYFWHKHNKSEFFYVLKGQIEIQLKGKASKHLKTGEFLEIKKNVWHCPKAKNRAVVLMIEHKNIKTIKNYYTTKYKY